MAGFNKVILIGNLTRDPVLKYLPSGTPVVEFGLAMNRRWRDRESGDQRESVTYVDCKTMGRQAEVLNEYMAKGRSLFVEGRLDYRSWDAPDGTKRSKLEVFVENFQFLGGGREGSGGASEGGRPRREAGRAMEGPPSEGYEAQGGGGAGGSPDDVPF